MLIFLQKSLKTFKFLFSFPQNNFELKNPCKFFCWTSGKIFRNRMVGENFQGYKTLANINIQNFEIFARDPWDFPRDPSDPRSTQKKLLETRRHFKMIKKTKVFKNRQLAISQKCIALSIHVTHAWTHPRSNLNPDIWRWFFFAHL